MKAVNRMFLILAVSALAVLPVAAQASTTPATQDQTMSTGQNQAPGNQQNMPATSNSQSATPNEQPEQPNAMTAQPGSEASPTAKTGVTTEERYLPEGGDWQMFSAPNPANSIPEESQPQQR